MKVAFAVALLLWSPAACAQEGGAGAARCVYQIRLDGTTYIAAGYTEVRGTQFGTAVEAECDDVGPSPQGSEFTENSKQVAVWSLPGYATEDVVAVRFDTNSFTIFVDDSMARHEIDRVVEALASSPD